MNAAPRTAVIAALAAGMVLASLHPAPAAIITGLYTGNVGNTTYNLSAMGTNDWAYWSSSASSGVSGVPTNEMSGATLIGNMSAVGGGTLRGSTSTTRPAYDFAYANGATPVSGITSNVVGLFNTQLNTAGAGVTATPFGCKVEGGGARRGEAGHG